MINKSKSNKEDLQKAYAFVKENVDHLDLIIHLAGVYMLDSLVEISEERFEKIFNINVFGVYKINKLFLPLLSSGSRIVIITSELASLDPLPFTGIYAITKGALEKYSFSLRMELQLLGIDVTTLRAGAIETPLLGDSTSELDKFVSNTKLYTCNATHFKEIVDSVESKTIEPSKIANLVNKVLSKKNPKYAYSINRNCGLKLLNALPDKLQVKIISKIIKY